MEIRYGVKCIFQLGITKIAKDMSRKSTVNKMTSNKSYLTLHGVLLMTRLKTTRVTMISESKQHAEQLLSEKSCRWL